jgi:hypothetical protein
VLLRQHAHLCQSRVSPRGGGSYLNELDANFTTFAHGDKVAEFHWTGKLRGPDFEKIAFRFVTVYTNELADAKGRLLPTVMAEVVTDEQEAESEEKARWQENKLLAAMVAKPHGSLTDWAQHCGWVLQARPSVPPKPNKSLVQRVMKRLLDDRLVRMEGRGYVLTKAGLEAIKDPAESAA